MADKIALWKESGVRALAESINSVIALLTPLKNFYESFPATGDVTFGVMNRKPEAVAGAGYEVLARQVPTAMSLALESLRNGRLVIVPGVTDEMLEEMKELIGEERWDELAAATASTLENKIVKSQAEVLAEALKAYDERKAQMQAALKEIEQMAEADNMTVEDMEEDTKVPPIGRNDKLV